MKISNENDWEKLSKSFQSICLDSEEKQAVLDTLQVNISKRKKPFWYNMHSVRLVSTALLIIVFVIGGYQLAINKTDQNSITAGGPYQTPIIPILAEFDLRLSQDQIDTWFILDKNGSKIGEVAFCKEDCEEKIDPLKVMEERELKGLPFPTKLVREHVKSMEVFQTQHYILSDEDGDYFAYLQIVVPEFEHELEEQAPLILESFQKNIRHR